MESIIWLKTKVLIWGSKAGGQCAVIQGKDIPDWCTRDNNRRLSAVYIIGF
jgi:hypothetical protein